VSAKRYFHLLAGVVGFGAAWYAAYITFAWHRYGRATHTRRHPEDADPLLDFFIPVYDAVERHHLPIAAPAEVTLAAAYDLDLRRSAIIRGIFKSRELILRDVHNEGIEAHGLLAQAKGWGWGVLAEISGRAIVFGAVTQPWVANPVFQAIPRGEFRDFNEPGYVKIVWTLRADPVNAVRSVARTETRVATTDPAARAKFRPYWSFFSPGIILIRRIALKLVKAEAERRAR
jgi:hypothetical protein